MATLASVDVLAMLAESKIRDAIAEGRFDDLPGRGKPLPREDVAGVPPELRMGFKLLRDAGCLPPELEARKEVARLGTLIETTGVPAERSRLSAQRTAAELRHSVLAERRRRAA